MDSYRKLLSLLDNSGVPGGRAQDARRQLHGKYIPDRNGTAEDVQFASINQKIRTPEGTDWAADGMSLEPPLSQIWASVESD